METSSFSSRHGFCPYSAPSFSLRLQSEQTEMPPSSGTAPPLGADRIKIETGDVLLNVPRLSTKLCFVILAVVGNRIKADDIGTVIQADESDAHGSTSDGTYFFHTETDDLVR